MSRVKLIFPEKKVFSTIYKVGISDINYGNHLGNDSVLGIVHNSRIQFLKSIDCSELNIGNNAGIIMSDCAIIYKNEAFHDDELVIDIFINEPSRVSFDLYYRLIRSSDNTIISEVKTGIVCFNYEQRKVTEVPGSFLSKIE